jgi:hypothetical protein
MTSGRLPTPGDIGLVAIGGRVGLGIRVGQWLCGDGWHHYEHAFVYVGDDRIVEAEPGGARESSLQRYDLGEIAWLRCPPIYGDRVAAAARAMAPPQRVPGVPYSFVDYLAIAAHRVHIPTPRLRAYIDDSGHMICSQLCDRAAEAGGWHLFDDGRWHGYVRPGDLYRLHREQRAQAVHDARP